MCKHTLDLLCVLSSSCRSMQSFLGMLIMRRVRVLLNISALRPLKILKSVNMVASSELAASFVKTPSPFAPLIKDKQMLLAEILYDHCPGILVLIFPPPLFSLSLLLTSIFTLMSCSFLPLLSGNCDLYLGTLCHLVPLFL